MRTSELSAAALLLAGVLFLGQPASTARGFGIDPESNTDAINPAAESYEIAEAQRQAQVVRQLELNDFLKWSTYYGPLDLWGPPLGGPPVRQPIGHESKQIGPDRWMYRPVYPEDVTSSEVVEGLPANGGAAESAQPLPAPSDAAPGDYVDPDRVDPNRVGAPQGTSPPPEPHPPAQRGPIMLPPLNQPLPQGPREF